MKNIRENISEFLDVISVDEFLKNQELGIKVVQLKEYLNCEYTEDGKIEPIVYWEGGEDE